MIYLTSRSIASAAFMALVSRSVAAPPDYQLANLILMGVYVGLTLVLAVGAIVSVFITRASLNANVNQAQEALAASEKQSQAAIDAVHRQIEEDKQQSQEILYGQNRPMIIWHTPTADSASAKRLGSANDTHIYNLDIENVGSGIATNIWSVLCMAQSPREPPFVCTYAQVLVPNKKEDASFYQGIDTFTFDEIEGYSFYPQERGVFFRVVATYLDIFNRKHLSIFDCESGYRWKQIRFKSGIGQTLEEMRAQKVAKTL